MRNGFSPWIRALGGIVWWKKNRGSKISWQCPFNHCVFVHFMNKDFYYLFILWILCDSYWLIFFLFWCTVFAYWKFESGNWFPILTLVQLYSYSTLHSSSALWMVWALWRYLASFDGITATVVIRCLNRCSVHRIVVGWIGHRITEPRKPSLAYLLSAFNLSYPVRKKSCVRYWYENGLNETEWAKQKRNKGLKG
jgi:hypothetical protein